MRRVILSSILGLGASAAAGSAEAQVIYNQPPAGSYGGGLVELLMTGRDPTLGYASACIRPPRPRGNFINRGLRTAHTSLQCPPPQWAWRRPGSGGRRTRSTTVKPWSGAALTSPEGSSSIR